MTLKKISSVSISLLLFLPSLCFSQSWGNYRKAITYFKHQNDSTKTSSAKFITEFVQASKFVDGAAVKNYDTIFPVLEKLRDQRRQNLPSQDFREVWKGLVEQYNSPSEGDFKEIPDSLAVDSNFLVNDINLAYKIRGVSHWGADIPQDIFNEFVLPYRAGQERIENDWRLQLFNTYNPFRFRRDSTEKNFLQLLNDVQRNISLHFDNYNPMWSYPFDIPVSKMQQGRLGSCRHLANYTTLAMRSIGIPATVDFTLLWGNNRTGHMWNVVFPPTGGTKAFDAAHYPMSMTFDDRKVAKIYRQRNLLSKEQAPSFSDVPEGLFNASWQDVTHLYTSVSDISVKVPKNIAKIREYVLIGTFNNSSWVPQFFAKVRKGKAVFKSMGSECVYLSMYLDNNQKIQTFGQPFLVDSLGRMRYFSFKSETTDLKLARKYHQTKSVAKMMESMVGCEFTGSTDERLINEISLFKITDTPRCVVDGRLDQNSKVRFVKIRNNNAQPAYIGEVEFFNGLSKIVAKAENDLLTVDGDLNSYSTLHAKKSIIYDLGTQTELSHIRYVPRSDTNFILIGNNYQLCIWKGDAWEILGTQVAAESELIFTDVPKNGLYLLHNLTQGREERIFSYENGKQIWY